MTTIMSYRASQLLRKIRLTNSHNTKEAKVQVSVTLLKYET